MEYPDANNLMAGKLTYGDFEATKPSILEATGAEKYNLGNKLVIYKWNLLMNLMIY